MNLPLNIDLQQIFLHMLNFVILAGGLYRIKYSPPARLTQLCMCRKIPCRSIIRGRFITDTSRASRTKMIRMAASRPQLMAVS